MFLEVMKLVPEVLVRWSPRKEVISVRAASVRLTFIVFHKASLLELSAVVWQIQLLGNDVVRVPFVHIHVHWSGVLYPHKPVPGTQHSVHHRQRGAGGGVRNRGNEKLAVAGSRSVRGAVGCDAAWR